MRADRQQLRHLGLGRAQLRGAAGWPVPDRQVRITSSKVPS